MGSGAGRMKGTALWSDATILPLKLQEGNKAHPLQDFVSKVIQITRAIFIRASSQIRLLKKSFLWRGLRAIPPLCTQAGQIML